MKIASRRVHDDRHICIVVQNLPVPFDRRVWLECQALRAAGYEVSVVCPKGKGDPAHHEIDGVQLFKYRPFPPITRQVDVPRRVRLVDPRHVREPGSARGDAGRSASCRSATRPTCSAWRSCPFMLLFGVRLVYDQHDLCPELYESRFAEQEPGSRRCPTGHSCSPSGPRTPCASHVISHERVLPRAWRLRRGGKRAGRGHRRAHRAGPGELRPVAAEELAAARLRPPAGLHRGDGPPGRRRLRPARAASHRARPRSHRRRR